jgi:pimeloyl-ACP methyl ester carboxylesterase
VLFLHGLTDSWRSSERVLPHLPESIRAIALTHRGHGDADRPATGYRTRAFAEDVAGFMGAFGLEERSSSVTRWAAPTPCASRSTTPNARGTGARGLVRQLPRQPGRHGVLGNGGIKLTDPIDPGFAREFKRSTLAQPVPAALIDTAVRESLKVPAHVWRVVFQGCLEDDFVGELCRIEVPTLILWGTRDVLCARADQEALLAEITGAQLIVYQGAGHGLHWKEPERFAADVASFAEHRAITGIAPASRRR